MKITCPDCNTSYKVPDDYIGAEGRPVKCANCGQTWHAQAAPPEPPKDLETGLDSSQGDIDALFDAPAESEEQSQDDIDALFDSPGGGEDQSQDDIDAMFDAPSGGEDQSQDDIDAMFDSPAEQSSDLITESESDPFVVTADDDDDDAPVVDMVDAAAFEAQKAVARGTDIESSVRRRQRRRARVSRSKEEDALSASSRKEWMVGGAALTLVACLICALLIAPRFWVRTMPDLASLYNLIGIDVNVAGVTFDMVDVRLVQQAGAPVIAVQADLVNPGSEPVILPSVQLSVLGNNDSELYSWAVGPDNVGLGPGEKKRIETTVAAPSQAKSLSLRLFHE